jgi:hypothetical protein
MWLTLSYLQPWQRFCMNTRADPRFFFIHIMKTAGTTFSWQVLANFDEEEVYPSKLDADMELSKFRIDLLTALPPERRRRIRVYLGHFPFVAHRLLAMELVTLTILRDPIERTISFLKQHRHYSGLALEEIYETPELFLPLIHNHQAKIFAMTRETLSPFGIYESLEIDERQLNIAKENLEQVDIVGFQERFPEFLQAIAERYGWRRAAIPDLNVSVEPEGSGISRSFRQRIAEDNAADLDFYEHARRMWRRN